MLPVEVAKVFSIELTVVFNFVVNDLLTFRSKVYCGSYVLRLARYNALMLCGLCVNYVTVVTLTYPSSGLNFVLANFIGVCFGSILNFILCRRYVWT